MKAQLTEHWHLQIIGFSAFREFATKEEALKFAEENGIEVQ